MWLFRFVLDLENQLRYGINVVKNSRTNIVASGLQVWPAQGLGTLHRDHTPEWGSLHDLWSRGSGRLWQWRSARCCWCSCWCSRWRFWSLRNWFLASSGTRLISLLMRIMLVIVLMCITTGNYSWKPTQPATRPWHCEMMQRPCVSGGIRSRQLAACRGWRTWCNCVVIKRAGPQIRNEWPLWSQVVP